MFLRARGLPLHRAEDLTQEFFLQFLQRDWLQKADRERGRFRNFILRLLVWFVADQGPKRSPAQRRFEQNIVSVQTLLTDEDRAFEPSTGDTPEIAFMKQWAATLVDKVKRQLRELYQVEGRQVWFDIFASRHFSGESGEQLTQEELATKFGMNRNAIRKALDQVQKRFDRLLRAEIRDEIGEEAEIDREITELLGLLEGRW